jgi:hypothetical protein
MTPEQAAALRQPFPKSAIGKLPKGGTQLDYVGHAATTDRLLAVDPEWSWEPVAFDDQGLPAFQGRNLWIKLTVAGVTRYGVGDGGSVKECIGDAIRNAAMRFGVALDLWSKEELEGASQPAAQPSPGVSQPPPTQPHPDDGPPIVRPITDKTRKALFALMTKVGIKEADDQRAFLSDTLGRPIESRTTLTELDGIAAGKRLRRIEQGDPDAEWQPTFPDAGQEAS